MDEELSGCNHKWRLVYYGSEPDVECSKCDISIYDVHTGDEARPIIKRLFRE